MSPAAEVAVILVPFWVIASFPAAVVIGRHLARRSRDGEA
jgi:hypothetical protein